MEELIELKTKISNFLTEIQNESASLTEATTRRAKLNEFHQGYVAAMNSYLSKRSAPNREFEQSVMDFRIDLDARETQVKNEIKKLEEQAQLPPEPQPAIQSADPADEPIQSFEMDPMRDEPPPSTSSSLPRHYDEPNLNPTIQAKIHSTLQNPTTEALQAIIKEIAHQFDEIAAGNYPKPSHKQENVMDFDEPMLGVSLAMPPQQFSATPQQLAEPSSSALLTPNDDNNDVIVGATKEEMKAEMEEMRTLMSSYRELLQAQSVNPTQQSPLVQLKMDRVQLPTFNGDLTQWVAFRDQFLELVHNNKNLSPITKFYQLKNNLRGLALDAINGFKMCASDYETAWIILRRRYDKTDQIIDEYIRTFEQLPFLTHANMPALIKMVNKTSQLIRVLPALGIDVKSWDTWILFTLKSRLDRTTLRKWMDQVKLRQNVPLSEFMEFLEVEAFECMPTEVEKTHARSREAQVKKKKSYAISMTVQAETGDKKCPMKKCNQSHPIYRCDKFRALSVKDRIETVQGAKLCIRCLVCHITPVDCKLPSCFTCQRNHNHLLCYRRERENKEKQNKLKIEKKTSAISATTVAEKTD